MQKAATVLAALALASSLGTAEPTLKPTPPEQALWRLAQTLVETPIGGVQQDLLAHGFSAEAMEPLRDYVLATTKRNEKASRKRHDVLCADRANYDYDSEALAQKLDEIEDAQEEDIRDANAGLQSVLSETDFMALQALVAHRRSISFGEPNSAVVRRGAPPAEYLQLLCDGEPP